VTRPATRIVIDASAMAALLLPDEADPPSLQDIARSGLDAPWLFWAELRNILIVSERRGRLPAGAAERLLGAADGLRIRLHADPSEATVLRLARTHGLSVYDALYLDLSLRLGAPLMTLDGSLAAAARAEGCTLDP
jgi:predicted nucleic acid-binding protein